jgi:hypothetical protein
MDEITAWHEAGHAVVAVMLGGVVDSVSVELPDAESAGVTSVFWGNKSDARTQCINDIHVALAGPIAEMIFVGDYDYLRIKQEHAVDWDVVAAAVARMKIDAVAAEKLLTNIATGLYHRLRDEIVWSAVADVAERLELDGTIDGETVNDLAGFWLRQI